jgi:hypothetical protein
MFVGITFPFFGGLLGFFGGIAFAPTTYFVSIFFRPVSLQQSNPRVSDQIELYNCSFPASCGSSSVSPSDSASHGSATG